MSYLEKISKKFPDFNGSNWLLRIPLAIVFIQMGLSKFPISLDDANSFGLPMSIWLFVAFGELFSGLGLLVGGLFNFSRFFIFMGDLITRFSGIVIVGIMTGVIFITQPTSLIDILINDNFHVMLYTGGLFFALRGSRVK